MNPSQAVPNRSAGFSLVELMTVVAIISLLAMLAVPKYDDFIARVRSTEAKVNLSGLYVAEIAYKAEYQTYTSTLDAVGFAPTGLVRFNLGFDNAQAPAANGPQGTPSCRQICPIGNCGGGSAWICATSANNGLDGAANAQISVDKFRAGTHAHLSTLPKDWISYTIDQDKRLQQIIPGN